jgi:hypothetical protein
MRGVFELSCFLLLALQVYAETENNGNGNVNNGIIRNLEQDEGNQYNDTYYYDGDDAYDDEKQVRAKNCDNSIVEVTGINITCDSPYAYYYGNGAHRNSQLCDYGDKALMTVFFTVNQDLDEDQDVYMTLGVYASKARYELLYAARAVELCQTFVGHQCQTAGTYAFAVKVSLAYAYGDHSRFVPVVELGFSTKQDEGYDLGGVNIYPCQYDGDYQQYDPWFDGKTGKQSKVMAAGGFAANYGLLLGVAILLVAFAGYAWQRLGNQVELPGNSLETDLMEG